MNIIQSKILKMYLFHFKHILLKLNEKKLKKNETYHKVFISFSITL